jgi:hypothetical protein
MEAILNKDVLRVNGVIVPFVFKAIQVLQLRKIKREPLFYKLPLILSFNF